MINNNVFAALIILIASLCMLNYNSFEGFMDISGTNARHAYLPQTYKNQMSIRNFKPHGSSSQEEVRELETFNYNPKPVRNNIAEVEQQFKSIENFQQRNMNSNVSHNTHTPNELPKHNLSETYIPQRPDYELSRGIGVSVVTPVGYRNGAKPSYGVDLLRGNIFEGYSTPQFGSPNKPSGNLRYRGDPQNPDPRGTKQQETGQTGTEKKHGRNTGDASGYSWGGEGYVPKVIRRGKNNDLTQAYEAPLAQMYDGGYQMKSRRGGGGGYRMNVDDSRKQQFMDPPINL